MTSDDTLSGTIEQRRKWRAYCRDCEWTSGVFRVRSYAGQVGELHEKDQGCSEGATYTNPYFGGIDGGDDDEQ